MLYVFLYLGRQVKIFLELFRMHKTWLIKSVFSEKTFAE